MNAHPEHPGRGPERIEREQGSEHLRRELRRIFQLEATLSALAGWEETPECAGPETLSDYLDGALEVTARSAFETHLELPCRYCLRALAELSRGLEHLK